MKEKIDWLTKARVLQSANAITYLTKDGVQVTMFPGQKQLRYYRVAIYCRVSTAHNEQEESLQSQLEYYREFVCGHQDWICVGEYADIKSARSIHAREQFEQMIQHCMEGRIDIVITKTVSRFGRNTVDTLSVLRKLKEKNVDVFFESQGLHSCEGNDELLLSVMEAIAQAESESRSREIKWGIEKQTQNPDAAIYSRPCYGYRQIESGELEIHEEEANIVRLIYEQYLSGLSILGIKRALEKQGVKTPTGKDIWPKRTIETILSNRKYIGESEVYKTYCAEYPDRKRIRNQGERSVLVAEGHHAPIINRSMYDAVQEEKLRRSNVVLNEYGTIIRKSTHYSSRLTRSEIEHEADKSTCPDDG